MSDFQRLVIALWVRSQTTMDSLIGPFELISAPDRLAFLAPSRAVPDRWRHFRTNATDYAGLIDDAKAPIPTYAGFYAGAAANATCIAVPHWFAVICMRVVAAVPWIAWPQRFSLRSLLIVMTLVAVVLGAIVYAVR